MDKQNINNKNEKTKIKVFKQISTSKKIREEKAQKDDDDEEIDADDKLF